MFLKCFSWENVCFFIFLQITNFSVKLDVFLHTRPVLHHLRIVFKVKVETIKRVKFFKVKLMKFKTFKFDLKHFWNYGIFIWKNIKSSPNWCQTAPWSNSMYSLHQFISVRAVFTYSNPLLLSVTLHLYVSNKFRVFKGLGQVIQSFLLDLASVLLQSFLNVWSKLLRSLAKNQHTLFKCQINEWTWLVVAMFSS